MDNFDKLKNLVLSQKRGIHTSLWDEQVSIIITHPDSMRIFTQEEIKGDLEDCAKILLNRMEIVK